MRNPATLSDRSHRKGPSLAGGFAVSLSAVAEGVRHRIVPFLTRILEHLIRVVAVQWKGNRPWLRIDLGIVDGHRVVDGVGVDTCEALGHPHGAGLRDSAH